MGDLMYYTGKQIAETYPDVYEPATYGLRVRYLSGMRFMDFFRMISEGVWARQDLSARVSSDRPSRNPEAKSRRANLRPGGYEHLTNSVIKLRSINDP